MKTNSPKAGDSYASSFIASWLATCGIASWLACAPNLSATDFVWTGAIGSDWFTAGNWSPAGVPGPDDTATIKSGSVIWSGNVSVRTLNFSGAFLGGSAVFQGTLNWTNGWFSGAHVLTLAAGSTLNVLPGPVKVMQTNYRIANAGTIHWDAPWAFESGAISNLAGGQIIITTSTPADPAVGGMVPIYHQTGALLRVTTSMTFPSMLQLFKAGDVEITNGTLTVVRPLASSGRWSLPTGAGLRVQGDASFADGTLFDGSGLVTLTGGGTVTFAGAIHAPNLALDGSFVVGDWTLNGTLNWTSGWLTDNYLLNLGAVSTLRILPGGIKALQRNFKIANAGTIHWDAPLGLDSGGITNLAGGQIILSTATPADPGVGGLVAIHNQAGAVFRVTNVTTTVVFPSGVPFHNQGALEIWQGILNLLGNYSSGTGCSLKIGLGGTAAGAGFGQLAVGGSATLTGTLQVQRLGGFTPAPGDLFTVISCGIRGGDFDSFLGGKLGNGLYLDPIYQTNGVTLRVRDNRPVLAPGTRRLTDGNFPVLLTGAIGVTYGLDTTTNFATWDPVAEVTLSKGTVSITHTNAGTEPYRFYRAKVLSED